MSPIVVVALRALVSRKTKFFESISWVESFRILLEFRSSESFNFLMKDEYEMNTEIVLTFVVKH